MLRTLTCLFLFLSSIAPSASAQRFDVRVDPRVELLVTVARLAEFREFTMPNSNSPYSERIAARFGPLKSHAVIERIRSLRAERGVSYDAIASLAVHLGPLPELEERVDFSTAPERLDARWGGALARPFLAELRDFAQAAKAKEFFESERAFYGQVEVRLSARLTQSLALPWFDGFFGARGSARYTAIAGLLCGGGNYGVGVRFPDERPEEITPVFGCWTWDSEGLPVFGETYLPLFVHELCHTYTNPFVDRHAQALSAAMSKIHATCAEPMKRQGYGNWKTIAYESLVRASVVRCRIATEGADAGERQAREEVAEHFRWVPELAQLFGEYENNRNTYKSFESFMPRVIAFFDGYAAKLPTAAAPVIVELVPRNGADDVDPTLSSMVITFDREMTDQAWSIVGSKADQPEITGSLAYDAQRRVLTVPIRLEPSKTYRFSLNSTRFQAFRSKDGVALEPVEVTFTTRAR